MGLGKLIARLTILLVFIELDMLEVLHISNNLYYKMTLQNRPYGLKKCIGQNNAQGVLNLQSICSHVISRMQQLHEEQNGRTY